MRISSWAKVDALVSRGPLQEMRRTDLICSRPQRKRRSAEGAGKTAADLLWDRVPAPGRLQ
jgi:hypothetical protein